MEAVLPFCLFSSYFLYEKKIVSWENWCSICFKQLLFCREDTMTDICFTMVNRCVWRQCWMRMVEEKPLYAHRNNFEACEQFKFCWSYYMRIVDGYYIIAYIAYTICIGRGRGRCLSSRYVYFYLWPGKCLPSKYMSYVLCKRIGS